MDVIKDLFNTMKSTNKDIDLYGLISVQYSKSRNEFYLGVPAFKDEEAKKFLYEVIDSLYDILDAEGSEC